MRPRFTLGLLAAAVALAGCAAQAAASPTKSASATRVFREYVAAPAQFDLSLAEIRFGAPAHVAGADAARRRRASQPTLALLGTAGLNYLAGAVTRFTVRGRPRLLVLVVNRRPAGSLAPDLARIGLRVTAARRLGAPVLSQVVNPFTRTRPVGGLARPVCDLPIRGAALTASDLRAVLGSGRGLAGFAPAAAVAQAYDAVCARPYAPAFRQAVTQGSHQGCEPPQASIAGCCPPNAICAPPPCPPCPCPKGPCPLAVTRGGQTALACPQRSQPIVCPL